MLGAAAGGGFPQWNCNCRLCAGVRDGSVNARPRTQSSIALGADGTDCALFNASPDILQQLKENPALQPWASLIAATMKSSCSLVTERPNTQSPSESAAAQSTWMSMLAPTSSSTSFPALS